MRNAGQHPLLGSPLYSRVGQWRNRRLIKSIQRISITATGTSATGTIAAVDPSNSILRFLGNYYTAATVITERSTIGAVQFTNATTITLVRNSNADGGNIVGSVEVIEFWPGVLRSVQRGSVSLVGVASAVATLTAVQSLGITATEKLGVTTDNADGYGDLFLLNGVLTSLTGLTATRGGATSTAIYYYQAYEFYL